MEITEPIHSPYCFMLEGESKYPLQKVLASAAYLFGIGYLLDGNYVPLPGYDSDGRPTEAAQEFPLPSLMPSERQYRRTSREELQRFEGEEIFRIEELAIRLAEINNPEEAELIARY